MTKQNWKRRSLCLLLCVVSLFFLTAIPVSASAEENPLPSMQEASAVYFYHIESDRIIGTKNESAQISAGTSVKIMSGLLFCEALKGRMSEAIVVTAPMLEGLQGWGHRLGLQEGDVITIEQLLYGSVCGSYNDAFYILAHTVSGSLSAFVEQMNARGRAMGLESTYFTDPAGLDNGSVTTAEDIAKLSLIAYENPLYLKLCGTGKYTLMPDYLPQRVHTIYNRNAMIASQTTNAYYNKDCIGMSAGSVKSGEQSVVALARRDGETYLCVILGALETENAEYGYVVANRLFKWAFQNYTYREVISAQKAVCTLPITVSDLTSEVEVCTHDSLSAYLPKGAENQVEYSIRLMYTELEAPVEAGTHVGYVAVIYQGRVLGTLPLYTAEGAERSSIISSLKAIRALTSSRPVLAGLIFFVVAIAAWITVETLITVRRRHKWDKYFSQKIELPPDMMRRR